MTFSEAVKYYYSLRHDERVAWQEEFINHANTVKDLQFVLGHVHKKYRKSIVTKMRQVAKNADERKIASFYRV